MRSPAVQLCPALRKQAASVASTAASRSASSRITSGPLPPISRSSSLPAAREATVWPVAIEPMNPTAGRAGVRGDLVADHRARAGHHVEHAGRQARPREALGERGGTDVVAGRRDTTALPSASAGRQDLRRHRVRPVPRADHADDAPRHAVEQDPLVRRRPTAASGPPCGWRRRRPCRSRRSAPRPRRAPRPRGACPGRARSVRARSSRRASITVATRRMRGGAIGTR